MAPYIDGIRFKGLPEEVAKAVCYEDKWDEGPTVTEILAAAYEADAISSNHRGELVYWVVIVNGTTQVRGFTYRELCEHFPAASA